MRCQSIQWRRNDLLPADDAGSSIFTRVPGAESDLDCPNTAVLTGGAILRLEPLYRVRFTYPESWMVSLEGGWKQHLFLDEGRCEGSISGHFRGANYPQRRTAEGPFLADAARSAPHGPPSRIAGRN